MQKPSDLASAVIEQMGASSSVDSFGTSEAAAKEAERANKVAYQQRAVNYARTHLFSESPMKVNAVCTIPCVISSTFLYKAMHVLCTAYHNCFQQVMPTREGGLTMTVDPARANEMLDQRRGRLGAPHLVSLTPAGDLIIQVRGYSNRSACFLILLLHCCTYALI